MTQVRREEEDGKDIENDVNSELEKKFFDNKIVPMWASTKVAANILGVSPNALRIRKYRKQIECKYFGNQLRFNLNYLQTLLRETQEVRKE